MVNMQLTRAESPRTDDWVSVMPEVPLPRGCLVVPVVPVVPVISLSFKHFTNGLGIDAVRLLPSSSSNQ